MNMKRFFIPPALLSAMFAYSQIPKTVTTQSWTSGAWVNEYRNIKSVDGSGYLLNDIQQEWDELSSVWNMVMQTSYTNNPAGQSTDINVQSWKSVSNSWETFLTQKNTYGSNNQIKSSVVQHNTAGYFENSSMNNYTYDAKGHMILREVFEWSDNKWNLSSRETNTVSSQGFVTQMRYENLVSGKWVNEIYLSYSYFDKGKPAEVVLQRWVGGAWQDDYKSITVYDQFGYYISQQVYEWINGAWVQTGRYTSTNHPDGRSDFFITEFLDGSSWVKQLKVTYEYFSTLPAGIAELSEELTQPAVYFDLSGRRVEKQLNVLLIEQRGNVRRKIIIQDSSN
jgi:hypothetical protein